MKNGKKVYINGNILTMDAQNGKAQAVAIKDGVIVAIGLNEEVLSVAGNDAEIVDIAGKTMLPGFIDAHSHFYQTGLRNVTEANLNSPPIGDVKCIDDIIALLSERAINAPEGPGYGSLPKSGNSGGCGKV